MSESNLIESLRQAAAQATAGSSRHVVLCRMDGLLEALTALSRDNTVSERLRQKAKDFLAHVDRAWDDLGVRLFHAAFALNVVGEALVRTSLLNKHVIEFVHVGLYFYGHEQIERRWPHRSAAYGQIHADFLQQFVDRAPLKGMVADGREKLADGRVFCLTYAYLNGLRRAYWEHCRSSVDVLDRALGTESLDTVSGHDDLVSMASDSVESSGPLDRMALMMHIFSRSLSPRQRWIYLAKNRASLLRDAESQNEEALDPTEDLGELLARSLGEGRPDDDLGWTEIAKHLDINEKTAKREYLRALETLLRETASDVMGEERQSAFVRRILSQLRAVIQEKDLRIKSATGRGMGTLVEKWEVALRYVLNHDRVVAG